MERQGILKNSNTPSIIHHGAVVSTDQMTVPRESLSTTLRKKVVFNDSVETRTYEKHEEENGPAAACKPFDQSVPSGALLAFCPPSPSFRRFRSTPPIGTHINNRKDIRQTKILSKDVKERAAEQRPERNNEHHRDSAFVENSIKCEKKHKQSESVIYSATPAYVPLNFWSSGNRAISAPGSAVAEKRSYFMRYIACINFSVFECGLANWNIGEQ